MLFLPLLAQDNEQFNDINYVLNRPYKYIIIAGGGYAYRMGKLNSSMDDKWMNFYRDLHNSPTLNTELYYCLNARNNVNLNLGINTDYVSSIAEVYNETFQNIGMINKFTCRDQYFYVAPSIMFTKSLSTCITMFGGYHIGAVYYSAKEEYDDDIVMSNSIALGWGVNAGLGYNLSKNLISGIKMKCFIARIKSVNLGNQTIKYDEPLSASHITITAFIGFMK